MIGLGRIFEWSLQQRYTPVSVNRVMPDQHTTEAAMLAKSPSLFLASGRGGQWRNRGIGTEILQDAGNRAKQLEQVAPPTSLQELTNSNRQQSRDVRAPLAYSSHSSAATKETWQ